jgi:hypothetical protein
MTNHQSRQDINSLHATAASRIQGGSWNAYTVRPANELHDEIECHWAIERFIFEQGLPRDEDFG